MKTILFLCFLASESLAANDSIPHTHTVIAIRPYSTELVDVCAYYNAFRTLTFKSEDEILRYIENSGFVYIQFYHGKHDYLNDWKKMLQYSYNRTYYTEPFPKIIGDKFALCQSRLHTPFNITAQIQQDISLIFERGPRSEISLERDTFEVLQGRKLKRVLLPIGVVNQWRCAQ